MSAADNLFAGLFPDAEAADFPTIPTRSTPCGNEQTTDNAGISHTSHISHPGNEGSRNFDSTDRKTREISGPGSRATSYRVESVGNVGSVGNKAESLAVTGTCDFPLSSSLVGKSEGRWEMDGLPAKPTPIPSATVRAAVEREMRHLASLGVTGPDAESRAVAIVRAKIGNSEALAEKQPNTGRCHACREPLDGARPEIAVLNPGGPALHMHQGECHDAYCARRRVLVARIMAAAGYSDEVTL